MLVFLFRFMFAFFFFCPPVCKDGTGIGWKPGQPFSGNRIFVSFFRYPS